MRFVFFFSLIVFVQSCRCGDTSPVPTVPRFWVSGLYVTFERSSFCRTWDTIAIFRNRRQTNTYVITRKSTFQRNIENMYFPVEWFTSSWTGCYNDEVLIMGNNGTGQDLQFIPKQNALRIAGKLYAKIE
jgi:hypothetical protein